jgi:hypothetical protein
MRVRLVATGLVAAATLVWSVPVLAAPPSRPSPVDLDAMFIGAHPDDEAFTLSTFGQWDEYAGVRTGVIPVTRGEGGGNAVGPEEGPAWGSCARPRSGGPSAAPGSGASTTSTASTSTTRSRPR